MESVEQPSSLQVEQCAGFQALRSDAACAGMEGFHVLRKYCLRPKV